MITIVPFLGMLGLAMVAPAPADNGKAEHVVAELSSFTFTPATSHLRAVAGRFVTRCSRLPHERFGIIGEAIVTW